MKKLIALISPEGKSKEQLTDELHEAMQKYFRVEKEVVSVKEEGMEEAFVTFAFKNKFTNQIKLPSKDDKK